MWAEAQSHPAKFDGVDGEHLHTLGTALLNFSRLFWRRSIMIAFSFVGAASAWSALQRKTTNLSWHRWKLKA